MDNTKKSPLAAAMDQEIEAFVDMMIAFFALTAARNALTAAQESCGDREYLWIEARARINPAQVAFFASRDAYNAAREEWLTRGSYLARQAECDVDGEWNPKAHLARRNVACNRVEKMFSK